MSLILKKSDSLDTQLKDILDTLSYKQKAQLKKIAIEKDPGTLDGYLLEMGLINKNGKIFCPDLEEFILAKTYTKLPVKEARLFSILKENLGRVVEKDKIFEAVWGKDSEEASDWALNALIYRLKRNSAFHNKGFIIENHKKVGYQLIKN